MIKMITSQREWAMSKMGKRLDIYPDRTQKRGRIMGTVVDFKADTVCMGVFFICELDDEDTEITGDRFVETYRTFPVNLSSRVAEARAMKRSVTSETMRMAKERQHLRSVG